MEKETKDRELSDRERVPISLPSISFELETEVKKHFPQVEFREQRSGEKYFINSGPTPTNSFPARSLSIPTTKERNPRRGSLFSELLKTSFSEGTR